MSSVQIPIWLTLAAPLGAALLGIIGVAVGQLISASRADRRESLRARAEFERAQLNHRQEKSLWWIEQQASVHEKILTFANECRTYIDEVRADNADGIDIDSREYNEIESKIDDQLRPLIDRTNVIAPPEIHDHIRAINNQLATLLLCTLKYSKAGAPLDYDDEYSKLDEEIQKARELIQADLGISTYASGLRDSTDYTTATT